MKKSNKTFKIVAVLLLIVSVLSFSIFGNLKNTHAISYDNFTDYSNTAWFTYYDNCFSINFKGKSNYSGAPLKFAKLSISNNYPYSQTVYIDCYIMANKGVYYSGSGLLKYTVLQNGSYVEKTWGLYSQTNGTYYITLEFYDLSSYTSYNDYITVPTESFYNLSNTISNSRTTSVARYWYDVGNNFQFYLNYNNAVNEVLNSPEEYGLYSHDDLLESYNSGYSQGLIDGEGELGDYTNIMNSTFSGFSQLLNVEIFPNITLGLIIGLPILLGLFLIVIKMIKD